MLPGLVTGNLANETLYDAEAVRMIMERHSEMTKGFREVEFSRKLEIASNMRLKGYEDVILKEGDLEFYQHGGKKSWPGPVRICSLFDNLVVVLANGSLRKVPKCNDQLLEEQMEEEQLPDRGEDLSKNIRGRADLVKNWEPNIAEDLPSRAKVPIV